MNSVKYITLFYFTFLHSFFSFCQLNIPLTPTFPYFPDNEVKAMTKVGNTIYVGGTFRFFGLKQPYSTSVDLTTGFPDTNFVKTSNLVRCAVADGSGGWYIAGDFTSIGGQPRNRLARINSDGTLHSWNPDVNGVVHSVTVSGNKIYIGGAFTIVGGQTRNRLARFNSDGTLDNTWTTSTDKTVRTITVGTNYVYVGGEFTKVNNLDQRFIAGLNISDGSLISGWFTNTGYANQTVYTIALNGSILYVGGNFSGLGSNTLLYKNLAALNATTGQTISNWNPNPSSQVNAILLSGTTLYVGGNFSSIGGSSRNRIASLNTSDGMATSWNPNASTTSGSGSVSTLTLNGSTLYVGGSFSTIGGKSRINIAALNTSDGNATNWFCNADAGVFALSFSNNKLYVGGQFTIIGGPNRNRIAAIDVTTGNLTSWNPDADNEVYAIASKGGKVYVGGIFNNIGGQSRSSIAEIDSVTALATSWDPNTNPGEAVHVITLSDSKVYVGGFFTSIRGQTRNNLARINSDGTLDSWNPNASSTIHSIVVSDGKVYVGGYFTTIGGQSRNKVAQIDIVSGTPTSWDAKIGGSSSTVYAIKVSGSKVYVGGDFTQIATITRNRIAELNITDASLTTWNPNANNIVRTIAVTATAVFVGGNFTAFAPSGSTVSRSYLAALDIANGVPFASWDPNAQSQINIIANEGQYLYAGGLFTSMGSEPNVRYLASFQLDATLPVTLIEFNARKQGFAVSLNWLTASEKNNKGFHIQRSINGRNFYNIGFIPAIGYGNSDGASYSFTDNNPIKGANFYRLQQVDLDGTFSYSGVRLLKWDDKLGLQIYPNPVTNGVLYVQLNHSGDVQIFSIEGKLQKQYQKNIGLQTLQVPNLKPGLYILRQGEASANFIVH